MDMEQGLRIGDLGAMIRRRAGMVAATAGAVTLLSVFIAAILPNEYESSATLLVEPQEISENLVKSGIEGRDINDRLHIIQMQILSRGRLSRVIDDLHLYPEKSQEMTREEVIGLMRDAVKLEPILPELEQSILNRRRDIEINTFRLSFRYYNAKVAAAVTNRLANDFIDEHIRERVALSGGTSEFIQSRLDDLKKSISEVEKQIADVKSKNTGSLPEDLAANQQLQQRLLDRIRDARGDQAIAESDRAFYGHQMTTGAGDYNLFRRDTPESRLEALRLQLGEYKSRGFTDKHPDVVSAKQEIAQLEAKVAETASGKDDVLSVAQQNASAEQQRAALRAASAKAEAERLSAQLTDLEKLIAAEPRVAEQLAALERHHESLFKSYQEFSDKNLEANVSADMERRQKGERFQVLESAFPAPEASAPNRPVIVIVGILLGLAFGAALALVLETADTSFYTGRSLQEQLRIPVLAAIPVVELASDALHRRRRQLRNVAVVVVVTGMVLVASVLGNRWVNGGGTQSIGALTNGVESQIHGEGQ